MAKYLTVFVIIALVVLTFLTISSSKDHYKILPIGETDPGSIDLDQYDFHEWHEFEPPSKSFKVMFPTLPQHASEKIKDPKTDELRVYNMYVSEKIDGTVFMISLIAFANSYDRIQAETLLREMMDDMVASNEQNTLQDFKSGEYLHHPSLEYLMHSDKLAINVMSFMVENVMYVLTRVTTIENFNLDEFNFFINSFELAPNQESQENLND
jgi:hypothetical protein